MQTQSSFSAADSQLKWGETLPTSHPTIPTSVCLPPRPLFADCSWLIFTNNPLAMTRVCCDSQPGTRRLWGTTLPGFFTMLPAFPPQGLPSAETCFSRARLCSQMLSLLHQQMCCPRHCTLRILCQLLLGPGHLPQDLPGPDCEWKMPLLDHIAVFSPQHKSRTLLFFLIGAIFSGSRSGWVLGPLLAMWA